MSRIESNGWEVFCQTEAHTSEICHFFLFYQWMDSMCLHVLLSKGGTWVYEHFCAFKISWHTISRCYLLEVMNSDMAQKDR